MKKLKYILTSLLTVVMCFSVLKITAKASLDYNVKSLSFTHGSVSISSGFGEDISGTLGGSQSADIYNYLSFTFDKYYSGTVTLKWTYSSSAWRQNLTDWNILVIGGKIDSNNNTSGNIVFRVYDTDNFMVIMTYNSGTLINGTDPTFAFSSASSSLTAVTNHNDLYNNVDNIDSQLSTANTQLTGIVSLLGALQNLQNTISTNVATLTTEYAQESDGITNTDVEQQLVYLNNVTLNIQSLISGLYSHFTTIETTLNDCNDNLANIEGEVDGVEELLTAITGTLIVEGVSVFSQLAATQAAILSAIAPQAGSSIFDTLEDILDLFEDPEDPTAGISAKINALNNKVSETNSKLDDIKTTLGNLLTAVNNIDTQIDTISWKDYTSEFYWSTELTADRTQWNTTSIDSNLYKDIYIYFQVPTDIGNKIVKFTRRIYVNSNISDINIMPIGIIGGSYQLCDFNIFVQYQRPITEIYIYPDFPFSIGATNFICCKVSGGNYYLRLSSTTTQKGYINSNDIEYFTLLSYFNDYKYHKNMLDLLSIDVDSENSLTIYNQDNTTIDNINTGLNNEYQTYLPFVNQQLSPLSNTTFLNEMSNQRTLFDYLFRNIFNLDYNVEDPSTVTNPIFLILIFGGILLALVG